MSDIRLFRTQNGAVTRLEGKSVALEKSLQLLLERNLDTFLGVRFIASEYTTGKRHGGRIDTLGIDEDGCPVIIEYKRTTNENVINQGLFYLDWLLDHKAEFKLLVMDRFGKEAGDEIEWSSPRLLCIAGDFTRYDEHAVAQINRNIELIRYRRYAEELLLLELVNVSTAAPEPSVDEEAIQPNSGEKTAGAIERITVSQSIDRADPAVRDLWEQLRAFILALGDDVQERVLKIYVAFRTLKNFATAAVYPQARCIIVWLKIDPATVQLEEGFSRDVSGVGHHGVGDLELRIVSAADLEKAKPLIIRGYEGS